MRDVLTAAAIAALGAAALWWGTDGGRALTSETARRIAIASTPRPLPDVLLSDQTGVAFRLSEYRGEPLVLEFVYATCPDLCLALGTAFERLDAELPAQAALLSISFDPADDSERLGWFAERHGAVPPRWRVARLGSRADREALLAAADVIAIPDGRGGFVHNAGLYLVRPDGRLSRVFDPEDDAGVRRALAHDGG